MIKTNIRAMLFVACIIPYCIQAQDTIRAKDILNMSLEEMMGMEVVSASKVSQKINEVPATIRVITSEQIKKRGYLNLEQALADLPGFQFRNINGFNTYSFLRGVPNQNNLVLLLIDGIQVNELNSGGFYGGGQYDMVNIDRIEVVYGPASALYGTNAVSGIINIITKKPENGHNGHISGTLGNFNTYVGDFSYDYLNDNDVGFRVAGMYKTSEKADLKEEKGDSNWTNDMENFEDDLSLSAYLKVKDFSASVNYLNKKSSRTTNYKTIDDNYLDRGTSWNIHFLNAYVKHHYEQKDKWSNQFQAYFRNATVDDNTIAYIIKGTGNEPGMQVGYFRPNHLIGAENQFNYQPVSKIFLTAGLVYEHELLAEGFSKSYSSSQNQAPPAPEKPDQLQNNLLSIYLQLQWHLVKDLTFTAGGRQDFSSYYGNVFTPRLALVYNKSKFSAKLMYNEAYRAPRPWDFTSGIGNEYLDPEIMKSAELAASYSITKYLNLEASVYNNRMSELLVREIVDSLDNWRWTNHDKVNTNGLEFGLNYKKQKFTVFAFYTYNLSKDQDGIEIPEIGKHSGNAGFTYNIYRNIYFHVSAYYIGSRINVNYIETTNNNRIEEAMVFNANLSVYNYKGFDLQLIADNLLDASYYHSSNRPPDRYRQPQRSIRVRIIYNFDL